MKKSLVKKKSFVNLVEDPHFLYYNRFEIQVLPEQIKNTKQWTCNICFYKHRGDEVHTRDYNNKETYKSKKEAIKEGFKFGQDIIDGKIRKFSIKGL